MARRTKAKSRRRRKIFRVLTALESYTYLSIITQNTAGMSPWAMITGQADLSASVGATQAVDWATNPYYMGQGGAAATAQQISLGDIIQNPGASLAVMGANLQSSLIPMAIQTALTGISFNIGRRLLSRPLRAINANLVKPALGPGVAL